MGAHRSATWITSQQAVETVADVYKAGRRLCRSQRAIAWRLKADGSFVTDLDREIEDTLRRRLETRFPGWVFIGEEGAPVMEGGAAGRPRMILDPIDGTAAFARGLNFFAISLGLFDASGRPALAILHLPAMQRWFVATFGPRGAVRHSVLAASTRVVLRRLPRRPPAALDLDSAYVYLGSDPHRQLDLSRWKGKIRALGATAAHLGLLLEDTIDPVAVLVTRYKIWDVAAGLALAAAFGFDIRALRPPRRRLSITDLLDAPRLPPLIVGRRDVLAKLLPRVRLLGS